MPPESRSSPSSPECPSPARKSKCWGKISGLGDTQLRHLLIVHLNKACNDGKLGWFETLLDAEVLPAPADDSSNLTGPAATELIEIADQEQRGRRRGETIESPTTRRKSTTEAEGVEIKQDEVAGEQEASVPKNAKPPVKHASEVSVDVFNSNTGLGQSTSTEERSTKSEKDIRWGARLEMRSLDKNVVEKRAKNLQDEGSYF